MKVALKEWAVVCRALASGRQMLILRKGGREEFSGEFQPLHREFLLLPTGFHQAEDRIRPDARTLLCETREDRQADGRVTIDQFASVIDAQWVESRDVLDRLGDQQILSDSEITRRFEQGVRPGLYALITRVYTLPRSVNVAMREEYAGCKSWVKLAEDVETRCSFPVLGDGEFSARRAKLMEILAGG